MMLAGENGAKCSWGAVLVEKKQRFKSCGTQETGPPQNQKLRAHPSTSELARAAKFDYARLTMAGGDSNPISRKLYARVKEMLVEQQRSPTGPLPHVDTIVEHLKQRSGSLQQCLFAAGRVTPCGELVHQAAQSAQ